MSIIAPWYQLGYVIPHMYTDLDAYQFYRVAPEGMMLLTTGLNLKDYTLEAVNTELPVLWDRFALLASKKIDRLSLSGVPVASALGRTKMREILAEVRRHHLTTLDQARFVRRVISNSVMDGADVFP